VAVAVGRRTSGPVLYYRTLLRQSATVFAGTVVLGACGFLFQMIASRRLGVETYGGFYSLLSIVIIACVPGALLSPVIARYSAEFHALHDESHVHGLLSDLARWAGIAALVYVALGFALAIPLASFLGVPAWTIPVVGVIAAVASCSSVLRAVAQGTQTFGTYALSASAEGLAKVAGLVVLISIGFRLIGGLTGYGIGALVGALSVAWMLLSRYAGVQRAHVRYDWRRIALSTGGAASITIATALIGTADVIVVKHFFPAHAAGLYSAAALAGKVLMFVVGFVPIVLLPRATDHHERGEHTRHVLWAGVAVLVAVAFVGGVALQYFGAQFLHLLVGREYDGALPLLLPYALAMIALGLANLLAYYGVATHRLAFAIPLTAGVMLTLVVMAFMHPTLTAVVRILFVGNVLTCTAVAGALAIQTLRRERAGAS
jgi:O-antigen/teichoic acid export membrane protein